MATLMPETAPMQGLADVAPVSRPSMALLGAEPFRAAFEYMSHLMTPQPVLPRGDGHPVVIFPGLATDGNFIGPLRDRCEAVGCEVYDWGRGYNTGPEGDLDRWLEELAADVKMLVSGTRQTATLIGWSLGGLYARELAKLIAPRVRQVITIGTPFNASADHTNVGWLYRLLSGTTSTFDEVLGQRLRNPPQVPTTSIYSRSDGLVAWQTCCHDRTAGQVEDVEIDGSHIGMGWNPGVLQVVGDRLAQPSGQWRPFQPLT